MPPIASRSMLTFSSSVRKRRIDRGQNDIGPRLAKSRRQRVAVHAASTVHRACAGKQMNDLHANQ